MKNKIKKLTAGLIMAVMAMTVFFAMIGCGGEVVPPAKLTGSYVYVASASSLQVLDLYDNDTYVLVSKTGSYVVTTMGAYSIEDVDDDLHTMSIKLLDATRGIFTHIGGSYPSLNPTFAEAFDQETKVQTFSTTGMSFWIIPNGAFTGDTDEITDADKKATAMEFLFVDEPVELELNTRTHAIVTTALFAVDFTAMGDVIISQ